MAWLAWQRASQQQGSPSQPCAGWPIPIRWMIAWHSRHLPCQPGATCSAHSAHSARAAGPQQQAPHRQPQLQGAGWPVASLIVGPAARELVRVRYAVVLRSSLVVKVTSYGLTEGVYWRSRALPLLDAAHRWSPS
jgi:hypothetical protein